MTPSSGSVSSTLVEGDEVGALSRLAADGAEGGAAACRPDELRSLSATKSKPMRWDEDFGFSNDLARLDAAKRYRDAAVADGWQIKPTYGDQERESTLDRDGFSMMILTRGGTPNGKWKCEASVNIWGPDRLSIMPPDKYDWGAIVGNQTKCNACGKSGVETTRYSFAGRCCEACLPRMQREHEYNGWCD